MATEFPMPKLGLTMTEGTILEWLVAPGSEVSEGAAVLRVETDKTETDIEAPAAGVLYPVAQPGDTIACQDLVAWLLVPGEAPPANTSPAPTPSPTPAPGMASTSASAPSPSPSAAAVENRGPGVPQIPTANPGGRVFVSPNARRVAAERGVDVRFVRGTGPGGRIVSEDVEVAPLAPVPATAGSLVANPLRVGGVGVAATTAARQLADLLGVDLAVVPYDPADGRVTKDAVALHVRALLRSAPQPLPAPSSTPVTSLGAVSPTAAAPTPLSQTPSRTVRMTGMRGTIAKRMHASLTEMAQLTLTMDAEVGAILADQQARTAEHGKAPGFTAYVIAAAARALRDHPMANAQVVGNEIAVLPEIHVGMAVALDEGLIVPVIRNTDQRSLTELGEESARLAAAARAGKLTPDEAAGGTFSVTALGMYGVDAFTPVINPPNSAILGVGRFRDDLALIDGAVTVVKRLTLSLTWDHRVLDGAPAAAFCQAVAQLLANPAALA